MSKYENVMFQYSQDKSYGKHYYSFPASSHTYTTFGVRICIKYNVLHM